MFKIHIVEMYLEYIGLFAQQIWLMERIFPPIEDGFSIAQLYFNILKIRLISTGICHHSFRQYGSKSHFIRARQSLPVDVYFFLAIRFEQINISR